MVVVLNTGVLKLGPVYKAVPPLAALYHFTIPADGVAVSVNEAGRQLGVGLFALSVGMDFIVAVTGIRGLDVQTFSFTSTQYRVVAESVGVVYVVPVPRAVPPVESAYQLMVPLAAEADKVKLPDPQLTAPVTPLMDGTA